MNLRTDATYSLAVTADQPRYPRLSGDIKTDVAVVGGGISGALIAYALAGSRSVCVLDKRRAGNGSTAASTSLLQYELDVPLSKLAATIGEQRAVRAYKLSEQAIHELHEITMDVAAGLKFPIVPSLQYASSESDMHQLQRECALRRSHGFEVGWLDAGQLEQLYGLHAGGGMRSATAASVDAYQLTHALLAHCSKLGHTIYEHTCVTAIDYGSEDLVLTTDAGYKVTAQNLVIACGYETLQYVTQPLAQLYTTYALVSEPLTKGLWQDRSLVWETAMPYLYLRPTVDKRLIAGGLDVLFCEASLQQQELHRKAATLATAVHKRFPLMDLQPALSWGGVFAATADGLPYISAHPRHKNAWFALGYGGNGITFSQVAARLIAGAITGRRDSEMELFSMGR